VRLDVVVEYATEEVPAPRLVLPESGTLVPKVSLHDPGVVVLMRNHADVVVPFGLPVPFKSAEVGVMDVAADVVAEGADDVSGVVKDCTAPYPLP
jgi:hypothetical protein